MLNEFSEATILETVGTTKKNMAASFLTKQYGTWSGALTVHNVIEQDYKRDTLLAVACQTITLCYCNTSCAYFQGRLMNAQVH